MSAGHPPWSSSSDMLARLGGPGPATSGGSAALPDDPTAFALGVAAPDPHLLAALQSVVETGVTYPALGTHLLRDLCLVVVVGVEGGRIQAPASPQHPPFEFVR